MTFKGFMKKFLPVFLMVPIGFGVFTACNNEKPDINKEEPPIVEPVDPNDKNPNKDPVDPGKEDPGKDNPDDPVTPVEPGKEDPGKDNPDDPVTPVDPSKEKPALTKEQEDQLIVNKILDATLEKLTQPLGKTTLINKVMAIDYEIGQNVSYAYILVADTTRNFGDRIDLIKAPFSSSLSRETILTSSPILANQPLERIFSLQIRNIDNSERTQNIYNKLKADGVLEQTSTPIAMAMTETVGGVDKLLQCATNYLNIYTISNSELELSKLFVKGDSGTKDYVTDYLLNGTLNKHYREVEEFYYKFSDNAIKDFDNGLTKKEVSKTTYTAGPVIYYQKEQAI